MTRIALTREAIARGDVHKFAAEHRGHVRLMTDDERAASIAAMLEDARATDGVWVFGYGSLIWNPAFHYVERRQGRIHGYHRRFCMWTELGRGCPDTPGLMLALTSGGCCDGVAYRIDDALVREELDILWRREMLTAAYRPTWVRLRAADGEGDVNAITFTIDRTGQRYAGDIDDATAANHIARAAGPLGRCSEYLFQTVEHLGELGIRDRNMSRLAAAVAAVQAREGIDAK